MPRFEDVAASFWNTAVSHLVLPPLTDDLVAKTQTQLNVRLPNELLVLLHIQNGGVVSDDWCAFPCPPNSYADDFVPFQFMVGIGPSDIPTGTSTLLDTPYLIREWDLPPSVVLLYGEGHYWVALDYRNSGSLGEPSVTWIDNEMGHELALAPNFRTFVEGLAPEPDWDANPQR